MTPWSYGDYTVWNWAIRHRSQPRRCRTRAMKVCQKRVNRVQGLRKVSVEQLVAVALRKTTDP